MTKNSIKSDNLSVDTIYVLLIIITIKQVYMMIRVVSLDAKAHQKNRDHKTHPSTWTW